MSEYFENIYRAYWALHGEWLPLLSSLLDPAEILTADWDRLIEAVTAAGLFP